MYNNQQNNDTIVALSTPKGTAALAIVRLSGNKSIEIINSLFVSKNLNNQNPNTAHFGTLVYKNEIIDEVITTIFKKPNTYTGEDIVEISCHGSNYIVEKIIQICLILGARLAKPGEFTLKAFLNSKLDLTQAEAVAELIHAENEMMHKTALKNLRHGFSEKLNQLKNQLIEFAALITLELDFAEEDVEFADRTKFLILIKNIYSELIKLKDAFVWGNAIKNGIQIAIIGKPNAGKSTLLNAILKEERAIVSPIAGTTRDAIEEKINYKDLTFRFIDTAGIRNSNDEIEKIGVEKAYKKMEQADMIIYLFDAKEINVNEIQEQEKYFNSKKYNYLLIANKIDTLNNLELIEKFKNIPKYFSINAKNNIGVNDLIENIYNYFCNNKIYTNNVVITNLRHYEAIKKIIENLEIIEQDLKNKTSADLLSIEIKNCLYHISELTGEVTNEHILDYVFSKFCIGK